MKALYVMSRENGHVKVGMSHSPEERADVISNAIKSKIIVHFQTNLMIYPIRAEHIAHKLLKPYHVGHEWFCCSVDEAKRAVIQAVEIAEGRADDVTVGIFFSVHPKALGGDTTKIPVPLTPWHLDVIDEWRRSQPGIPSRTEAIREAVRLLVQNGKSERKSLKLSAHKAP